MKTPTTTRLKLLLAAAAVALSLALGGGPALAGPGNPQAAANCQRVIAKQNQKGQTGAQTGSPNDKKQADTAVTNCDHFWTK